ncbi:uncharacterized protein MELLADRAFT_116436 [Melampsora larici-populina 98AG31]|uniref:IMD domain-containing protein n=1 Tax=Melampsora larici-populina (strain 98AG31 / pathotype 3-4-7) TaxID=747676 RepID=F4RL48_MELLP|nr:uncharacterized protein MELLADRAFT_116436 [Melampsora larici-populina 98AG31]EGG06930.1 hypothetical protein MELLADRAFT_116436 [Melampsora larici-populina 98AG31]
MSPAERLMAASGLHFMTANLEQVLSATFYKSFEIPLLDIYDHYRQQLAERQSTYEAEVSAKTKAIRETEIRNMKQNFSSSSSTRKGNPKQTRFIGRDLNSFRKGLKELQDQVESVEKVKQIYYLEVAGGEYEVWKSVADNISLIVKSEVEVYDRIASKATSDPTLELMITSIPDPFDTYNQDLIPNSSQAPEIYSILPPLSSILTPAQAIARKSLQDFTPASQTLEPNSSYQGSSVGDVLNHQLDSTTHWDHPINQPNELPPLPVVNYQSDDLEEEPEEEDRSNRYPSRSLFDTPPASPSLPHPPTLHSIESVPTINLIPQTQSFAPTPLRNMVLIDSNPEQETESVSNPTPDSNPNPEYSQDTIKCNLSTFKRASVLSGISLGGTSGIGNGNGNGNEESIMSQMPPLGIDSDSDLENSFGLDHQD